MSGFSKTHVNIYCNIVILNIRILFVVRGDMFEFLYSGVGVGGILGWTNIC